MKSVARTLFVKVIFCAFILLSGAGPLSGCAVVAPLLGAGGFAFAPLQYASTAYTLGEFTYEYAANDKNPAQVIEGKYAAVVSGEAFELPAYLQSEPAGPQAPVVVAEAQTPAAGSEQVPALSEEARRRRIENLLGERRTRFERLELRRMAFLRAYQPRQTLTLNQTADAADLDLVQAAGPQLSLD